MNEGGPPKGTIYGVPPGADFVAQLHQRLLTLSDGKPPEDLARINVLLPSRRMQRRLRSLFDQDGNRLLPRIGLVTDVTHLLPGGTGLRRQSKLARLLDLKTLVARLVDLDPRLSRADVIDLTISLTELLDEMRGEGVSFDAIEAISPDDQSGHWDQSLSFLKAIRDYVENLDDTEVDAEHLHRMQVEALTDHWQALPPRHPVLIAGSTGSRATTQMLMAAVADLPTGEVLLPGFDPDLPPAIWGALTASRRHEDHPQFRFAAFLDRIGVGPKDVRALGAPPDLGRNKLISLSLRPAPVTDQWLTQGPTLGSLEPLTQNLTLIEARDTREEALAIALAVRSEVEQGRSVALISPDATLSRRVSAELARWKILPDDSGGTPLGLTAPGRFLRLTGRLSEAPPGPAELVALLKHPMTRAGEGRGPHMKTTQEFEIFLRKRRGVAVGSEEIDAFVEDQKDTTWTDWLNRAIETALQIPGETLSEIARHHAAVVNAFAGEEAIAQMENDETGARTLEILQDFISYGDGGAHVTRREYLQLLERTLASESARTQEGVRPDVVIWGTLEARVQGADTVILCGLNEGVWPEQPKADPWLNRAMRQQAGLLLPERQIGLAAHDFQQAIGAARVILTRPARSDGAETVPSRWLSRLTNLLGGLPESGGPDALKAMRHRGRIFLNTAAQMDRPHGEPTPEPRPAPAPPVDVRPRAFYVTEIQRLIRDPYDIYARRILRLAPLDPLTPVMDARLKGTVIHEVLEDFFNPDAAFADVEAERQRFREIADRHLAQVTDPIERAEWFSQLDANFAWLFEEEVKRRHLATPLATEQKARYIVPGTGFEITGKADRIDRLKDGRLVIYDYKTGAPPSHKDILLYDRQLVIEAVMAEVGAFAELSPETVARVVHLGVGRTPKEQVTALTEGNETVSVPRQLRSLLEAFLDPALGYTSRRAMDTLRWNGEFDHLARFGEWDESSEAVLRRVP